MHEILKLDFFNETSPSASARSEVRAHTKIRTQIEVIDQKTSRFRPGKVGWHISTSHLLSFLLITVGLSLFAFIILVSAVVDKGRVHQLEDVTSFPLVV